MGRLWICGVFTVVSLSALFAAPACAHPGSGIVIDDKGRVFFQGVGPEQVAHLRFVTSVDPTEAGNNRCSAATCAVLQVGPETGRTFGLQALAD